LPPGPQKWELYNIEADPGETSDLSEQDPVKLNELVADWETYQAQTGVVGLKPDWAGIAVPQDDPTSDDTKWMQATYDRLTSQRILKELREKKERNMKTML
jgi:hypothetical protein